MRFRAANHRFAATHGRQSERQSFDLKNNLGLSEKGASRECR
jgi:hypothetical protein